MKISKISRDASRDFENRISQVFIESLFTIVSRELFFLTVKTTFFFFFQKFLVPVQPVRQHSIDHRSFVGDIAAPSCERRRAYTSLISEGHTAHCRRNKAFRTVALLYWSDFLFLSFSLLLLLAILSHKTSYSCIVPLDEEKEKKRKKRDERSHPPPSPPSLVRDIYRTIL